MRNKGRKEERKEVKKELRNEERKESRKEGRDNFYKRDFVHSWLVKLMTLYQKSNKSSDITVLTYVRTHFNTYFFMLTKW